MIAFMKMLQRLTFIEFAVILVIIGLLVTASESNKEKERLRIECEAGSQVACIDYQAIVEEETALLYMLLN